MNEPLVIEDFPALKNYLRRTGWIGAGEEPVFTNLAGGVSNRTVLMQRPDGEAWVFKQALGKLRVQVDWFSDPRRIECEAAAMQWLARLAPPGTITKLTFLDAEHHLLAMEAVPQPHTNWKTMLLAGHLEADHVGQFAALLAAVHRNGFDRAGELSETFDDRSFFQSLRIEPYYAYTARQVPEAARFLDNLIQSNHATRYTLVHGDYSPKNILVHNNRLILLDHEVVHFGEGAFDLGFALTHLLSKAHYLGPQRALFGQASEQFWDKYRRGIGNVAWSKNLEQRAIAHALGCLLARCAGRSPLEYLDANQRKRQLAVVVGLMQNPPRSIAELIARFLRELERDES